MLLRRCADGSYRITSKIAKQLGLIEEFCECELENGRVVLTQLTKEDTTVSSILSDEELKIYHDSELLSFVR